MGRLLSKINNKDFVRIHRSTIINTRHLLEIINSYFGEIDVKMKDQKLFRVSKSYRKEFLKVLGL